MQGESAQPRSPEPKPNTSPDAAERSRPRGIVGFKAADASLLGLGTQMLSEVAAGILLGLGADYLLGTHNRWIVVGSIGGVVVAMWTVIRTTIRMSRRDAAERARRAAARGAATDATPSVGVRAESDDQAGGASLNRREGDQ